MKLKAIASATIFSLIPISVSLATFFVPNLAAAQSLGQAQSDCMRQTLYDSFGNVRRGMTAEAAAFACSSAKPNSSASECVLQTMYDSFGNIRRGMTAEAAAFACGSAKANSSVSECVLQTMYDSFGNIRQRMSAQAAAFACADYRGFPIPVIILQP